MIGFIIGLIVGELAAFLVFAFGSANKEPKPPGKKLVYIASPYRGDRKRNLRKAEKYTRAALDAGAIPITPHLFYSTVLNDDNPEQRERGMAAGTALLLRCDEVWAFGEPSEGMKAEIAAAEQAKIPVKYHSEAGGRKGEA
ncbi:MAG: DUF4406 domain-containing protein [Bacteroides sp.]